MVHGGSSSTTPCHSVVCFYHAIFHFPQRSVLMIQVLIVGFEFTTNFNLHGRSHQTTQNLGLGNIGNNLLRLGFRVSGIWGLGFNPESERPETINHNPENREKERETETEKAHQPDSSQTFSTASEPRTLNFEP